MCDIFCNMCFGEINRAVSKAKRIQLVELAITSAVLVYLKIHIRDNPVTMSTVDVCVAASHTVTTLLVVNALSLVITIGLELYYCSHDDNTFEEAEALEDTAAVMIGALVLRTLIGAAVAGLFVFMPFNGYCQQLQVATPICCVAIMASPLAYAWTLRTELQFSAEVMDAQSKALRSCGGIAQLVTRS
mmetsp:Transcript_40530/g.72896  ORF Transcript_40530/g.72896 Transcript_40530/m.72896 type:complete len:188 (-) Transcript_40530:282-845(-)|eukprot:CAMPEP_0197645110 /NCGR_PEP_ID=MMETSP1338-20131121/17868_1 /TAXON_ID=43686 ORGANISM="Pelagodinium beii, Strain RCC1491" /NCGR_SAMPLE_ID=MMETSP1338 /ASSEMBLY_ACC=CAM_ASM_000754 /LENGTH=187 /DNA_ID=CAMNT_0043218607 /DNA_START=78 /DNA_END=641 /DNA_ORIENTATION=-